LWLGVRVGGQLALTNFHSEDLSELSHMALQFAAITMDIARHIRTLDTDCNQLTNVALSASQL